MPGLIIEVHLDEDVAWVESPGAESTLPTAALLHILFGDENVPEAPFHTGLLDALFERELHFVFIARIGLDDIPLHGTHTL
jgi:hypothetical protein